LKPLCFSQSSSISTVKMKNNRATGPVSKEGGRTLGKSYQHHRRW
jgi:hypothetical protein